MRRLWAAAALTGFFAQVVAAQTNHGLQPGPQAVSCSLPGLAANSNRAPAAGELLEAYNLQAALIHTLHASLILRGEGVDAPGPTEDNSRPIPTMMTFRAPTLLRMTGVYPLSPRRVFDLASDNRQFRLLVQESKGTRMIVGPVDAPATSTDFRENIRPQMALEAIRWLPGRFKSSADSASTNNAGSMTLDVELQTSNGRWMPAQLEFDWRKGTLARLIISDPGGKQASEVDYSDWQKAAATGAPESSACFPRRIFVTQPRENRKIEMKFMSVQVNVPVLPSQFQFVPPPGTTVTRVGAGSSAGTGGAKP